VADNRIRELRKERGLTQVELAQMLGVSQTAIYKLETGASDLDTRWMKKISQVLNVRPCELLPLDWQSPILTPEEKELLALFRKKSTPQNSTAQKQNKANIYKQNRIHERE